MAAARYYENHTTELNKVERREDQIKDTDFSEKFSNMSDGACLQIFAFEKAEIKQLLKHFILEREKTERNRHKETALKVLCVMISRLDRP